MQLELTTELSQYFAAHEKVFDHILGLRGEVIRALESRSTQRVIINQHAYFLKKHAGVGYKEIFKNLLQLRLPIISAKNEWHAIKRLESIGMLVPTIAGYGLRGHHPAKLESFLLTHELPPHLSLEDLTQNWRTNPPSFKRKRALIEKVATIAKEMHAAGVNHRDFYLCHFLLTADERLFLIDLHRAQLRSRVPTRWRIKDLAGLYFSSKTIGLTQRDLLHFVKTYRSAALSQIFNKEASFWKRVKRRGDQLFQQHQN